MTSRPANRTEQYSRAAAALLCTTDADTVAPLVAWAMSAHEDADPEFPFLAGVFVTVTGRIVAHTERNPGSGTYYLTSDSADAVGSYAREVRMSSGAVKRAAGEDVIHVTLSDMHTPVRNPARTDTES